MIHRSFRYKLDPTPTQDAAFRQFSGVCRLVYNLALEQRTAWYRQYERNTGERLSLSSQSRELTALRAEFDWIGAVSCICEQQALRDLDRAFRGFFSGRVGYPAYRRKGLNDGFRFLGSDVGTRCLNAKWSEAWIPKIGWVKFRDTRQMRGVTRNVAVIHGPLGWHISFACEIGHEAPINIGPPVGIDRGVANTLALSTGEMFSVPKSLGTIDRRHRAAQRVLARRKRGSKRRLRQLRRCAKLASRRARVRRDWHHKAGLYIAQHFGTVVLEDLKIANMTKSAKGSVEEPGRGVKAKSGLNRSILNQGWSGFETILSYKVQERGGTLIKVNPAYSSQTCSECGCIDKGSRESQARFACLHCGYEAHADTNAAIEILRRNTASMRVEGSRQRPVEARTGKRRKPLENPAARVAGRC